MNRTLWTAAAFASALALGITAGCKKPRPVVTDSEFDVPEVSEPGFEGDPRGSAGTDSSFDSSTVGGMDTDWQEETPQGPGQIPPGVGINTTKVIYFPYDSADITPDQMPAVEYNAQWIKENPHFQIRLEGHCDERGTEEYNVGLGDRRARAVKRQLVYLGADPARLIPISFGEMRPAEKGHDEYAWSRNRRVELWISRGE